MVIPLLNDTVVIFLASLVSLIACKKLKLPSIVGYLLAGVIIGPYATGLISDIKDVEKLAEVGVVLLMFTIGLEFSLANLLKIQRYVFLGGGLQVLLTLVITIILALVFKLSLGQGIFLGFLVSLSSTAIVLKILQDKDLIRTSHGRTALAVLVFQDLAVIPMMLSVPLISGKDIDLSHTITSFILTVAGILITVIIGSKFVVPWILERLVRVRSNEVLLLGIASICFSLPVIFGQFGLSLALGAFLAGLLISESVYSDHVFVSILPFKDAFSSIFFVSVGMLLDWRFALENGLNVVLLVIFLLFLKVFTAGLSSWVLGLPLRQSLLTAFYLAQVGEFSFVLIKIGQTEGLINPAIYNYFLTVSVLSMMLAPVLIEFAPKLAMFSNKLPLPYIFKNGYIHQSELEDHQGDEVHKLQDHLVVVGYGIFGMNLAYASDIIKTPYIVIESDPFVAMRCQKSGKKVFLGDATLDIVLKDVSIEQAKILVVTIHDPWATQKIIIEAKKLNPDLNIVVRTRYSQQISQLYELGATLVISEEFETSIEMLVAVMKQYKIEETEISQTLKHLRRHGYEELQKLV